MRLLLAEDEKSLSNALTAILEHSGYSVDAVYNGKDAVEYLENSFLQKQADDPHPLHV